MGHGEGLCGPHQHPPAQESKPHRGAPHEAGRRSLLLSLLDEDTDRYITNAINQIESQNRTADMNGMQAVSGMPATAGSGSVDPQLMQAMYQAAGANDVQAANSLLRSAKRQSAAQGESGPRSSASTGQAFDGRRIRAALGLPESPAGAASAVSTIDRRGILRQVPHDQLAEVLAAGDTMVMPMTTPDGRHGYVPLGQMHDAHQHGFELGHKSAGDGAEKGKVRPSWTTMVNPTGDVIRIRPEKYQDFVNAGLSARDSSVSQLGRCTICATKQTLDVYELGIPAGQACDGRRFSADRDRSTEPRRGGGGKARLEVGSHDER